MNARRFPRTLSEAFGPYTDAQVFDPPQAVFDSWLKWREAHAKPVNGESVQRDAIAEHASMQIPETQ